MKENEINNNNKVNEITVYWNDESSIKNFIIKQGIIHTRLDLINKKNIQRKLNKELKIVKKLLKQPKSSKTKSIKTKSIKTKSSKTKSVKTKSSKTKI